MQQTTHVAENSCISEIQDLLFPGEYESMIDVSEQKGFRSVWRAHTLILKCGERVIIKNDIWPSDFRLRLKSILPSEVNGMNFLEISKYLRFDRYTFGQSLKPKNNACMIKNKLQTKLSLMIYLNDDFTGGHTRFFDVESMNYFDSKPQAGKALLFDQDVFYAGLRVTSGIKYTLCVDIIYGQPKSATNFLSKITKIFNLFGSKKIKPELHKHDLKCD